MFHARKLMLIAGLCMLVLLPAAQAAPTNQSEEEFLTSLSVTPEPAMATSAAPVYATDRGKGGGAQECTATANCAGVGPNLSCSGSTCSAADRNCNVGQRGYVRCGTTTTYCAQPCPCSASTLCNDGSGWISCNGTGTACSVNAGCSVTCNGITYNCGGINPYRQPGSGDDREGPKDNIKLCPSVPAP